MAVATVLVVVLAAFGFGWFLLLAIALVIGAAVGRAVEGRLDVGELIGAISGRRRSS